MRRALKIFVSLVLLVVLVVVADWSQVRSLIATVHLGLAVAAIAAYAVQLFLSAWKWQWALIVHELRFRYGLLARVYWIAFFVNNFLPSSIGGDAYRVYRTLPSEGFRSRALSAVIVERLIGLAALLVLGVVGAWLLANEYAFARAFLGMALGGATAVILLAAALRLEVLQPYIARAMRHPRLSALDHNVGLLLRGGESYLPLIGLSLLFQAQAIGINYLLFAATGAPVALEKCALITAVAGLATIIPLSINGLGILEGAFAGAAIAVGVSYEQALFVAILTRVLVLPLSLIAGLLYALEPAAPPTAEISSKPSRCVRASG